MELASGRWALSAFQFKFLFFWIWFSLFRIFIANLLPCDYFFIFHAIHRPFFFCVKPEYNLFIIQIGISRVCCPCRQACIGIRITFHRGIKYCLDRGISKRIAKKYFKHLGDVCLILLDINDQRNNRQEKKDRISLDFKLYNDPLNNWVYAIIILI